MILENTENTQVAEGKATDTVSENTGEKTFTQAELDTAISERLARERKKQPSKEEMTLFKQWQAEQKTTEEPPAINAETDVLKTELTQAKAELELFRAGINPEYAEFVAYKLSKIDGEDMQDKVADFKKENPKYFTPTVQKQVSSGARMTNGVIPQGNNSKMNALIRGVKK